MTGIELLTTLTSQGFSLIPLPGDKLEVQPASKLTDDLRQAIKRHKLEMLAVLRSAALSLLCRQCNREARPDGGTLSKDGTNYIQFWRCLDPGCRAKGSIVFRLQ